MENDPNYKQLCCSLSGHLAENAVKDEEGNVYWDKAAILANKSVVPCPEIANEVDRLMETETPLAEYPENLVEWRSQFTGPKTDLMAYTV